MPEISGLHHIALTVTDYDASAGWYQRVLGFVELFREVRPERRAIVLGFPEGGYSVGLVQHDPGGVRFDPRRTGLDHLAFTVPSRSDLDAWAEVLTRHHVPHAGVADIAAGAILNFADPDGIALALFWDGHPA